MGCWSKSEEQDTRRPQAHCHFGGTSSRGRDCPQPLHSGTRVGMQTTYTPPPPTGPSHHYPTYPHGRGQAAPPQRHPFSVLTPLCGSASPDAASAGILDFFSIFLIFIYCLWLHLVSVTPRQVFDLLRGVCDVVPDWESSPGSLHWEGHASAPGPPGKSPGFY